MSHTIKCGCVIADSKDRSVQLGYELGGYVKEFCAEHDKDDGEVIEDMQKRIDELEKALADTFEEYNTTGHLSTRLCVRTGILLGGG